MGIVVGGEKAWKVRRKGDIVVAFHWVNREPAMVLFPAQPSVVAKPSAFCVALTAAYKYAQRNGYPTKYCVEQAAKAAVLMGLEPERTTVFRIADAILEGIQDLIEMPPEPVAFERDRKRGAVVGEATFMSDGQKVAEMEVEALTPTDLELEAANSTLH